eukprot:TRINITY_DN13105_c0_g1_i1.p1 TRINITY_DN13105_c0_g1~~TRINITY_DN13105_c0_g1_i1.p1  ORF type:complete len:123 (-),score=5.02 TRINITY_DN13105_c0_g1_i1:15-383(-)
MRAIIIHVRLTLQKLLLHFYLPHISFEGKMRSRKNPSVPQELLRVWSPRNDHKKHAPIPHQHYPLFKIYISFFIIHLSLIHISEPTRLLSISYAVFCLKKKKNITNQETSIINTKNLLNKNM